MRRFDKRERDFIDLIGNIKLESNEMFSRFLQNNYFTLSNNTALLVDHKNKAVIFYMSPDIYGDEKGRASQIKNLWSLIALLEYLEEQRYIKRIPITLHPNELELMSERFGNIKEIDDNTRQLNDNGEILLLDNPLFIFDKNQNFIFYGIIWKDLYESVTKLFLSVIFPSESIKYLIKHKYKTEEDYRYGQQYKLTWLGIGISIFLGLYSIIDSNNDDEFKEKQYKTIESIRLNSLSSQNIINEKLDSLVEISKEIQKDSK